MNVIITTNTKKKKKYSFVQGFHSFAEGNEAKLNIKQ